jgi:hypothetical protein
MQDAGYEFPRISITPETHAPTQAAFSGVPKTFVFGTLPDTPVKMAISARPGVPKPVPKSMFRNLTNSMGFGTLFLYYK